jgi:hypothetical protein
MDIGAGIGRNVSGSAFIVSPSIFLGLVSDSHPVHADRLRSGIWCLAVDRQRTTVPTHRTRRGVVLLPRLFFGAIGEELGWQGYAYPGLRVRRGAFGAALVLGAVGALFPNSGFYYDPFVTFVILAPAVGVIVFRWGPATLARFRPGGAARHENLRPPDASPEQRNPA